MLPCMSLNPLVVLKHGSPRSLTVAGQPFVEVYLSGQHHQLLEVEVHHADLCILELQVLLLLFCWRLLPIWLRLRLPATQKTRGGSVTELLMT